MRIKWYSPKDKLPVSTTYVLVYVPNMPWVDNDHRNVYFDVARVVRGISQKKRANLSTRSKRKYIYKFGDEEGNNLVPYAWDTFGSQSYFGQDVVAWCYLPAIPLKFYRFKD